MPTLRGKLPSLSLADVLQMLYGNRNSGQLRLTRDGQQGVFYLQQGRMVHAETAGHQGEAAARELLAWDAGEFEFLGGPTGVATTIQRSLEDLLMEVARATDTRNHAASLFPDLDQVPWATQPANQLAKTLQDPLDAGLLRHLDGYHSFRELIADSGRPDLEVLRACAALRSAGQLDVIDPDRTVELALATPAFLQKGLQGRLAQANEAHWRAMLGPWGKKNQPCRLARNHEAAWKAMGAYGAHPLEHLRLAVPGGPRLAAVQFVSGLDERILEVPQELMAEWQVKPGTRLTLRPARTGHAAQPWG